MRRKKLLVVLLAVGAIAAFQAPASPHEEPFVFYWQGGNSHVADSQGTVLHDFPDFLNASLGGHLLAGEFDRGDRSFIKGYDAVTGQQYFKIRSAQVPAVIGDTGKVAFFPEFRRDRYLKEIWMRMPSGDERIIASFFARNHPGIRTGHRGEAIPLDMAFDRQGRVAAIAMGNENMRLFDVFVVDPRTRGLMMRTGTGRSKSPSVSPSGERLALRHETATICPEDYRPGRIRLFNIVPKETELTTPGDCEVSYDTPRWLDEDTLLAIEIIRVGPGQFETDIVSIDPTTGAISDVLTAGNPCCLAASPSLRTVAYSFTDKGGFAMLNVDTMQVTDFPAEDAGPPQLNSQNRL